MRPQEEEYLRFIHLVDLFRDMGWEPARTLVPAFPADDPFRTFAAAHRDL
jgi:hypothetical protein